MSKRRMGQAFAVLLALVVLSCRADSASDRPSESSQDHALASFTADGRPLPVVASNSWSFDRKTKRSRAPVAATPVKIVPKGVIPPADTILEGSQQGTITISAILRTGDKLDLSTLNLQPSEGVGVRPRLGVPKQGKPANLLAIDEEPKTHLGRAEGDLILYDGYPDVWLSIRRQGCSSACEMAVAHIRVAVPTSLVLLADPPKRDENGHGDLIFRATLLDQDGDPMPGVPILFNCSPPAGDGINAWVRTDLGGTAALAIADPKPGTTRCQAIVTMLNPIYTTADVKL